jgi:hypothetical protein
VGFVDADGSGDLNGRKSISGYVFQVYGEPVVCGSKKHGWWLPPRFRLMSAGVKEATWQRGLLSELDIPV